MTQISPDDFERDLLLAARYAYYVKHLPFLSDQDYDRAEADYVALNGPLPVGSERPEDYSPAIRSLAMYFLFKMRESQEGDSLL